MPNFSLQVLNPVVLICVFLLYSAQGNFSLKGGT